MQPLWINGIFGTSFPRNAWIKFQWMQWNKKKILNCKFSPNFSVSFVSLQSVWIYVRKAGVVRLKASGTERCARFISNVICKSSWTKVSVHNIKYDLSSAVARLRSQNRQKWWKIPSKWYSNFTTQRKVDEVVMNNKIQALQMHHERVAFNLPISKFAFKYWDCLPKTKDENANMYFM